MTTTHVSKALAVGSLLLAVAGCTATPSAQPSDAAPTGVPTDAAASDPVCDSTLFTDVMNDDEAGAGITAETTPLAEVTFPLDGIEQAGFDVLCTGHMVTEYPEQEQTVEFDVVVTDAEWNDVLDALDESTAAQGWVRDGTQPIWRDPDDQNHYIQTLGVEGGVLVGTTEAG